MREYSPESPEYRRRHRARSGLDGAGKPRSRTVEVLRRVAVGVYSDGLIHAGNLAYLSILSLFPFFIIAASIARMLGNTRAGMEAVNAFLMAVPGDVAEVLRTPIVSVLTAQASSSLVWLGLAVALWTTTSLIETIRDILRRAYGTRSGLPFWHYRLYSIGFVMVTVVVIMFAFSLQVVIAGLDEVLHRFFPFADMAIAIVSATKLVPMLVVGVALYGLFFSLTPDEYRGKAFPKWPGAVMTALWWYGTLLLLPVVLSHLSSYDLTYGSLAGVMITLIFFFLVGLGVVIGAELNAALAEFPDAVASETGENREESEA